MILVTGASGFIGSRLVEELVRTGQPVRCLVRRTSDTRHIRDLSVPFVYVSSIAAAGPGRLGQAIREDRPAHPVSCYGHSKLHSETFLFAHADHLPVTVVRPPPVYGPRGGTGPDDHARQSDRNGAAQLGV